MNRSRIAAWVCMISSLAFAGIIVSRNLPPPAAHSDSDRWPGRDSPWRSATARERRAVLGPVQGQVEAMGRGDFAQAMQYFTPQMRERYGSPETFRGIVMAYAPEFVRPRRVRFGTVWLEGAGRNAAVPVQVMGEDGIEDGTLFRLERTEGDVGFRIAQINGGQRRLPPSGRFRAPIRP